MEDRMSLEEFKELAEDPLVSDKEVLEAYEIYFAGMIKIELLTTAIEIFARYRPEAHQAYIFSQGVEK